jgi:hypothetical protein
MQFSSQDVFIFIFYLPEGNNKWEDTRGGVNKLMKRESVQVADTLLVYLLGVFGIDGHQFFFYLQ